jgi:hypothetical protein
MPWRARNKRSTMATEFDQESAFDPRRRLCPDGNCIGIVGNDGKCAVCGTTDQGWVEPKRDDGGNADPLPEPESVPSESSPSWAAVDFDPNRRLCLDDTCIGVIGDDDRCKLCGKRATP